MRLCKQRRLEITGVKLLIQTCHSLFSVQACARPVHVSLPLSLIPGQFSVFLKPASYQFPSLASWGQQRVIFHLFGTLGHIIKTSCRRWISMTNWLIHCFSDWLTDSITKSLSDSLCLWLTEWLTESLNDWPTDWFTESLTDWVSD